MIDGRNSLHLDDLYSLGLLAQEMYDMSSQNIMQNQSMN